jgi:hypothetical protein
VSERLTATRDECGATDPRGGTGAGAGNNPLHFVAQRSTGIPSVCESLCGGGDGAPVLRPQGTCARVTCAFDARLVFTTVK